ncbi:MAG: TonB-dependent receptor [Bacteroidota bacterium]
MKNFNILIFFFLCYSLNAQELSQSVKGTVKDLLANYPLIGVNVEWLDGTNSKGTATDENGEFRLEGIPVGRQTFRFSYIGYKPVVLNNVLVNSAKELMLNVQMKEDLNELEEVVVSASKDKRRAVNEMATISARSMSLDELTRFSGTAGDVARMAQNYAGVSGASDDRNDIIVRGNSPSAVLWRMEGVDIPSPNHWATLGASGGPISMLNANNLRNSDFISSAFPAEYGNVIGAVFDLKLRNGNTDKFEFLGQIGFNGFEGGIEGPLGLGQRSSFLINYRYSTLGVFDALGIDFGTGGNVPQYQDVNFKLNIPTKKAGVFSLWGLGGISDITFEADPGADNLFSNDDENLTSGTNTGIIGLTHTYFFNDKTSSNLSIAYSATVNDTWLEELISPMDSIFEKTFSTKNQQKKLAVNWIFNAKLNPKNRIKAGLGYENYDVNVLDSILFDDDVWFSELDFEGQSSLYRGFAQWQHRFNNKLTLNAGLHTMYYGLNESFSIEPRLGLAYDLNSKHTLSLGAGRHSQLQPIPVYFSKDRFATEAENAMNPLLDFVKADHFAIAWNYAVSGNARIKLEAYYQSLFNLAADPNDGDFSMVNFGADFGFPNRVGLVNEGTGSNIGLELTLERFLNKGFYYLITASIFDSKYKGIDGVSRNTFFNSNYVFNILAGKEFKINNKLTFTLDARLAYAGGRRYTPINLAASIEAGDEVLFEEQRYEAQYDPYIKPNIKIGIRHNGKKTTQLFFVDLQNFISRENVFDKYYDEDVQRIRTTYQQGFFPDVRYQILF